MFHDLNPKKSDTPGQKERRQKSIYSRAPPMKPLRTPPGRSALAKLLDYTDSDDSVCRNFRRIGDVRGEHRCSQADFFAGSSATTKKAPTCHVQRRKRCNDGVAKVAHAQTSRQDEYDEMFALAHRRSLFTEGEAVRKAQTIRAAKTPRRSFLSNLKTTAVTHALSTTASRLQPSRNSPRTGKSKTARTSYTQNEKDNATAAALPTST